MHASNHLNIQVRKSTTSPFHESNKKEVVQKFIKELMKDFFYLFKGRITDYKFSRAFIRCFSNAGANVRE